MKGNIDNILCLKMTILFIYFVLLGFKLRRHGHSFPAVTVGGRPQATVHTLFYGMRGAPV